MPCMVIGGPHGLGTLPGVWSDEVAVTTRWWNTWPRWGTGGSPGSPGWPTCGTPRRAGGPSPTPPTGRAHRRDHGLHRLHRRGGARATRALLSRRPSPTAIVYDNDTMAVAGLGVAQRWASGAAQLSIVAWDDSPLCQLLHPQLSAVSRDIAAYGAHAADCC